MQYFKPDLKHLKVIEDKSYIILPEMIKKGYTYDCIILRGNPLFENIMVDFFYADKLLSIGGVIVLFISKFQSAENFAKYIQEDYHHYDLLPDNLGSSGAFNSIDCLTFVKLKEDSRKSKIFKKI